jgi:hypothetical protein
MVTELLARPLVNLWWPELAGVTQPLAGERAASRLLLEALPIPVGYGVELALLIDTVRQHGTEAIAQVDLGGARTRTSRTRISRSWPPSCCLSPSGGHRPAPISYARGPAIRRPPGGHFASSSARTACCGRGIGQCHARSGPLLTR